MVRFCGPSLSWVDLFCCSVPGYIEGNFDNLDDIPSTDSRYKPLGACVDINECDSYLGFLHFCGDDATCINTDGSYQCQCNTGFHPGPFSFLSLIGK